jgi:hypothetical protein
MPLTNHTPFELGMPSEIAEELLANRKTPESV